MFLLICQTPTWITGCFSLLNSCNNGIRHSRILVFPPFNISGLINKPIPCWNVNSTTIGINSVYFTMRYQTSSTKSRLFIFVSSFWQLRLIRLPPISSFKDLVEREKAFCTKVLPRTFDPKRKLFFVWPLLVLPPCYCQVAGLHTPVFAFPSISSRTLHAMSRRIPRSLSCFEELISLYGMKSLCNITTASRPLIKLCGTFVKTMCYLAEYRRSLAGTLHKSSLSFVVGKELKLLQLAYRG